MEPTPLTLRETIKRTVAHHLQVENGFAMGQCLTAVGCVGGTLPELYEADGMVELPMADVAGAGFAVGAALAGRRPMYVIRYQGFNWYNAPIIVNYACKSKEIWGRACPMFIRSIAMEGGIGPVAGSSHHSLYFRMPGIRIYSPMCSREYESTYEEFMLGDDVFYVSEHRGAYNVSVDLEDRIFDSPDFVLCPISITRLAALEASRVLEGEGIKVAVHNIFRIKPFETTDILLRSLSNSKFGGCVLDDDYVNGIAKNLAHDLSNLTSAKMGVLGLEDRSAGFSMSTDNLPPSAEDIVHFVKARLQLR